MMHIYHIFCLSALKYQGGFELELMKQSQVNYCITDKL